jgi:UDP-2,4-diacetamido-2,4,6-trideoxy-beta-L-altropyranose hydrolase
MGNQLLIRTDASQEIGIGHLMRMIALAQAWIDRGGVATIASSQCPTLLIDRLGVEKINHIQLDSFQLGSAKDLKQTIKTARQLESQWIVIDGYHFSIDFQRGLKAEGLNVAAIDDYGHCDVWESDIVLNQNIYAPDSAYTSNLPNTRFLLGADYCLLRKEFWNAKNHSQPNTETNVNLLVSLGGGDPENVTGQILTYLEQIQQSVVNRVLVGSANQHLEKLKSIATNSIHEIQILQNVVDMPEQYRWCDAVISAGGSTCWEWLYFQCLGAVVTIADNQIQVTKALSNRQLAIDLGWHADLAKSPTVENLDRLISLAKTHNRERPVVVDGFGAQRAAAEMDGGIWIRTAEKSDCRQYFEWGIDPEVRANSINSGKISWEEHCDWFEKRFGDEDCVFLVAMQESTPIGQVRFEKTRDDNNIWEIDFSIATSRRGTGVGTKSLSLAMHWLESRNNSNLQISAIVKNENVKSKRCFERLGFERKHSADTKLTYFLKTNKCGI